MPLGSGQVQWSSADTSGLGAAATIVGVGLYDALTTGNLVAYHPFQTPRVVSVGGPFTFDTDKLKIRLFGDLTSG